MPELSLSFFGEFYLNGKQEIAPASAPVSPPPPDPCAGVADHWRNADAVGTLAAYQDHLLHFPSCSFAGQAQSRIAALSKPDVVVPSANPFDGTWLINEVCEKKLPTWLADLFQFAGKVKDGIFRYQFGETGTPRSGIYEGKIEADGSAEINVKGLTGSAANDPLHRNAGSPFHYKMAVKLDGSRGTGAAVRIDTPRPCHSEWSRLSATTSFAPNADSDAQRSAVDGVNPNEELKAEKSRPDLKPAEARRSKSVGNKSIDDKSAAVEPDRRDVPARNRQMTSGLSCSKMLGRCGWSASQTQAVPIAPQPFASAFNRSA